MIFYDSQLCTDVIECGGDKVALGCYELLPDGTKHGSISIFDGGLENAPSNVYTTDAVLDMKWSDDGILYVATNSRGIAVLDDAGHVSYSDKSIPQVCLSLVLYDQTVCTSTSSGNLLFYDKASLALTRELSCHSLETWCVAKGAGKLLYTGADDGLFRGWDVDSSESVFVNKSHGAGVCSILCLSDTLLLTGSYDKKLRFWDPRSILKPIQELSVNGGVWRLAAFPDKKRIVAACMRDGFHVFEQNSCGDWSPLKHENFGDLAYGCSVRSNDTIFTCSFYNRQAQQWNV